MDTRKVLARRFLTNKVIIDLSWQKTNVETHIYQKKRIATEGTTIELDFG